MKTPFLLKLILFGFLVSSCSSNDDSPAPNHVAPPTSIVLSFDEDAYITGDSATFVVKDNFNNTVTTEAEVTVNGTVITTNPYTFTASGSYDFVATYEGLTSNSVNFVVQTASAYSDTVSFSATGAPTTFTKKALLEDFTGTWCVYCPNAASAIATLHSF